MYKVVFFKFFLFVLYLCAGLMSKISNYVDDSQNQIALNETNMELSQIGQATIWINPFITRFKVPTTTTTTTTTTQSTRRTARPRSLILDNMI